MLTEDAQYDYPPLMPGQKILEDNDLLVLYKKFSASNHTTCLGWYFTLRGQEYCLTPDGTEAFVSRVFSVADSLSGKDTCYVVGLHNIYAVYYKDGDFVIDLFPTLKEASQGDANFVFLPSVSYWGDDPKNMTRRVLYCLQYSASNGNGYNPTNLELRDLNDAHFRMTLPFSAGLIKNCIRFHATQRTFLAFCTVEFQQREGVSNIHIYALQEAALPGKTELKTEDFISYTPKSGYYCHSDFYTERVSPLCAVAAPMVIIDEDPGAQQLIMYTSWSNDTRTSQGFFGHGTTYLETIGMDATLKLETIDLFVPETDGQERSVYPEQVNPESMHVIINPDGSSSVLLTRGRHACFIHDSGRAPILWENYYEITARLMAFDAQQKKMVQISKGGIQLSNHPLVVPKDGAYLVWSGPGCVGVACVPVYDGMISDPTQKEGAPTALKWKGLSVFYRPFWQYQDDHGHEIYTNQLVLFRNDLMEVGVQNGKYYFLKGAWNVSVIEEYNNPSKDRLNDVFGTNTWITSNMVNNVLEMGFMHAAKADFTGQSIVVGHPHLSVNKTTKQIFGLYQTIPCEDEVQSNSPSISMALSNTSVMGVTKSTHATWNAGYSADASYNGLVVHVTSHFSKSYGGSKMHMKSDNDTISVHVTAAIAGTDAIHAYGSDMYYWEYPLFKGSVLQGKAFAYLTVLIPVGFIDEILSVTDTRFNYKQDYETGKLLTYLTAEKPGFNVNNLWFTREELTVTSDRSGGHSLGYSKSNSTSNEVDESTDDSINASLSISLGGFGFNGTVSGHYTKSNSENSATSTTRTTDYQITFSPGTIKDSQYEYTITPYVYTHNENNMLIIAYDVYLSGAGWKNYYSKPDIILMRAYPTTGDLRLVHFSRSIRFDVHTEDARKVDIDVLLFNNSLVQSTDIVCKIYKGMAVYDSFGVILSSCTLLATLTLEKMEGVERSVLKLKDQILEKNTIITVEITSDKGLTPPKYYWGIYPYEGFKDLK